MFFCDRGCKVIHDETEVRVMYKGKLVISRGRDTRTGLWILPITKKDTKQQEKNTAHVALDLQMPRTHSAANVSYTAAAPVYTLPYKQQQMKYMHQRFYNMPIPTLVKAIQNNQLTGFPCMTVKNVKKYLAPSPATPKGCMKRLRTGIRSTTKQKQQCA